MWFGDPKKYIPRESTMRVEAQECWKTWRTHLLEVTMITQMTLRTEMTQWLWEIHADWCQCSFVPKSAMGNLIVATRRLRPVKISLRRTSSKKLHTRSQACPHALQFHKQFLSKSERAWRTEKQSQSQPKMWPHCTKTKPSQAVYTLNNRREGLSFIMWSPISVTTKWFSSQARLTVALITDKMNSRKEEEKK